MPAPSAIATFAWQMAESGLKQSCRSCPHRYGCLHNKGRPKHVLQRSPPSDLEAPYPPNFYILSYIFYPPLYIVGRPSCPSMISYARFVPLSFPFRNTTLTHSTAAPSPTFRRSTSALTYFLELELIPESLHVRPRHQRRPRIDQDLPLPNPHGRFLEPHHRLAQGPLQPQKYFS